MPTCRSNGEAFFLCGLPELIPYRSGTVESRIRQLVMKLEYVDSLTLAHPFVKGFEQVHYCLTDEEVRAVAQGEISETVAKRKKEDIEGKENASTVYSTTFYIGLAIEPKQRTFDHASSRILRHCTATHTWMSKAGHVGPRKLDISYPTTEFTKLVKMWEKYDEATMGIVVRHIKRFGLNFALLPVAYDRNAACLYPTTSSTRANASQEVHRNGQKQRCVCPLHLLLVLIHYREGIRQVGQHVSGHASQETTVCFILQRSFAL